MKLSDLYKDIEENLRTTEQRHVKHIMEGLDEKESFTIKDIRRLSNEFFNETEEPKEQTNGL